MKFTACGNFIHFNNVYFIDINSATVSRANMRDFYNPSIASSKCGKYSISSGDNGENPSAIDLRTLQFGTIDFQKQMIGHLRMLAFDKEGKKIFIGGDVSAYSIDLTSTWVINDLSVTQLIALIKLSKLNSQEICKFYDQIKNLFNFELQEYIEQYIINTLLHEHIKDHNLVNIVEDYASFDFEKKIKSPGQLCDEARQRAEKARAEVEKTLNI